MTKSKFVVSKYYGEYPGEIDTKAFDTYEDAKADMINHCGFTKEEVKRLENGEDLEGLVLESDYAAIMCGTPYAEDNDINYDVVARITEVTFD